MKTKDRCGKLAGKQEFHRKQRHLRVKSGYIIESKGLTPGEGSPGILVPA
jgi:hypothetical protein